MKADIANKDADTAYKHGPLRYEPWKIIALWGACAGAMVAAVALMTALVRLLVPGAG